jgi:hypothetical protein
MVGMWENVLEGYVVDVKGLHLAASMDASMADW